ncbi:MAG: acyl--CoA ligase [Pseudomonadota bacterium]|nr:acyl--CoA ligase [Pseudomonadota bacterium]
MKNNVKLAKVETLNFFPHKETGTAIASEIGTVTYAKLKDTVKTIGQQLASLGVKPNYPVAIVLANGPAAAVAFVSVSSYATAAPLNPNYTKSEFLFYLRDLEAKLLILDADVQSLARTAAEELSIPVVELVVEEKLADMYLTKDGRRLLGKGASENLRSDVALILHTSGTTSRPKIVTLTVNNIVVSAQNICQTLALSSRDIYLNIMPLFHIHGLIAGVLATLHSGGTIFCSRGFDALNFFNLLKSVQPTWFSAVPTMHQAILSRAPRNQGIVDESQLRFIRSSSASLPVVVLEKLEKVFRCPVIEAYGMTEAAHQMSSNQLPPLKRKPGTVGIQTGTTIKIMSNSGSMLPKNTVGEIVIKGANVTEGYRNNLKANEESFKGSWFRTGDQGSIDEEGFLTIKGRIKEIINRGGEKVSPLEVDEALLDHANIDQAVTFAIPHDKLGEEVAAAVVLNKPAQINDMEIRTFLAAKLSPYKIPRQIVFLDEIPKGSTGKVQRIGLAQRLGFKK